MARAPLWREHGLRYNAYSHFLRHRFGCRVHKVSVDAGFTCPNVDGNVAVGGCAFCDNRSFSPSRRLPKTTIRRQLEEGIRRVRARFRADAFLAYFQPATNTYAPVDRLRAVYEEALSCPEVVGLAIGTRPDCVPDQVLNLLTRIAARTYLCVEYGLQSIHDRSLAWMNRGHSYADFLDALERSRGRGFALCAHVILGLPGESHDDMLATAREVARMGLDAVKLHNLYAVRNTPLAEQVASGAVRLMEREDYVRIAVDFLEHLPPGCVVERVSGDAPPEYFLGPEWCLDKQGVRRAIEQEFIRRESSQGSRFPDLAAARPPI